MLYIGPLTVDVSSLYSPLLYYIPALVVAVLESLCAWIYVHVQLHLFKRLSLMAICLMQPDCFWPSIAHCLSKQSVLNSHLSYTATNFWSPKTDLTVSFPLVPYDT
jgi:tryptophan-rich sensory protein